MNAYTSLKSLLEREDSAIREYNRLVDNYTVIMKDIEDRKDEYERLGYGDRFVKEQTEYAQKFLGQIPGAEKAVLNARKSIQEYFLGLSDQDDKRGVQDADR